MVSLGAVAFDGYSAAKFDYSAFSVRRSIVVIANFNSLFEASPPSILAIASTSMIYA